MKPLIVKSPPVPCWSTCLRPKYLTQCCFCTTSSYVLPSVWHIKPHTDTGTGKILHMYKYILILLDNKWEAKRCWMYQQQAFSEFSLLIIFFKNVFLICYGCSQICELYHTLPLPNFMLWFGVAFCSWGIMVLLTFLSIYFETTDIQPTACQVVLCNLQPHKWIVCIL